MLLLLSEFGVDMLMAANLSDIDWIFWSFMGCIFGLEMSRKAGEEKSLISTEALEGMLSESLIERVFSGIVFIM